jgi:hypothetical protein
MFIRCRQILRTQLTDYFRRGLTCALRYGVGVNGLRTGEAQREERFYFAYESTRYGFFVNKGPTCCNSARLPTRPNIEIWQF